MGKGKHRTILDYLHVPESKEVLKIGWEHVKRHRTELKKALIT